jgi:diguanylate cyclase (GGDEF)-like protein
VLLKNLARLFDREVKRAGDFAARWGGEEFVILLPNTDREGAERIAEAIRGDVERMIVLDSLGNETGITVIIGFDTISPTPVDTIDFFFTNSDNALYKAKNSGRNCVKSV